MILATIRARTCAPGLGLRALTLAAACGLGACAAPAPSAPPTSTSNPTSNPAGAASGVGAAAGALDDVPPPNQAMPAQAPPGKAIATFAGGCFWCMEKPFEVLEGVEAVYSGYTAGQVDQPTYEQVSAGTTGHTEAIRVVFDPAKVTYARLLEVFWHNIDPTQAGGQFCDRGSQYRTGIYPHDAAQRAAAEASKAALATSGQLPGPIATEILDATPFFAAETYHQDFYKKKPEHYARYRAGCGRNARLEQLWGDAAGH